MNVARRIQKTFIPVVAFAALALPANALACGNVHADANRTSLKQVDVTK